MTTARQLADTLSSSYVRLVHAGQDRTIADLEVTEPGEALTPGLGALVLAVGCRDAVEGADVIERAHEASGVVFRERVADDASVRRAAEDAGVALLAVADGASWSALIDVIRSQLGAPAEQSADLFELADTFGRVLDAPVTIEDATSRVVAYSTGQAGVDTARMSTIVGREVPRQIREHFRAKGVFRRLATSDAPIFVPAFSDDVLARVIIPIRAGGEWLGSVWAVKAEPADASQIAVLAPARDAVATALLKSRAHSELQRQVQLDQVRAVVRGAGVSAGGADWLGDGPWRVVLVGGPVSDASAEVRGQLWHSLATRRGWHHPLIADVDERVFAIVQAEGSGAGTYSWLRDLVERDSHRAGDVWLAAGAVADAGGLAESAATAVEVAAVAGAGTVSSLEDQWAAVVVARAASGLAGRGGLSPIAGLLGSQAKVDVETLATLAAVIDYWGEPSRAADALHVHPNTIRYRMGKFAQTYDVDLDDPQVRLAVRLEIASSA